MNIATQIVNAKRALVSHFAAGRPLNDLAKEDWQQYFIILGYATIHWSDAFHLFLEKLAATKDAMSQGTSMPIPIYGLILGRLYKLNKEAALEHERFQKAYDDILKLHTLLYQQRDKNEEGVYYVKNLVEFGTIQTAAYKKICTQNSAWQVQDPFLNTLLYWSNEELKPLGQDLGEDITPLLLWNDRAINTFQQKLWNQESGNYCAYNLMTKSTIDAEDLSSFMPIAVGIPNFDQVLGLLDKLNSQQYLGTYDLPMDACTSLATDAPDFKQDKPYHGAIAMLFNWMLTEGFETYYRSDEFLETANKLQNSVVHKVEQFGFQAHFAAQTKPNQAILTPNKFIFMAAALGIYWNLKKVDTSDYEFINDY